MNVHIETEQLIIRDIENFDANSFFDLDSDPEVHKYLGNNPIKTIKEAQEIIDDIRNQYVVNGIGRWAVIDKKTNDFIGWTGLKYEQKVRENFSYYDLGFRLKKKYWGKGIATETATECLQYGFTKLDLKEICAAANVDNIASNRVLRNIGLKFTEIFDFDGATHNWYKINKPEWMRLNLSNII